MPQSQITSRERVHNAIRRKPNDRVPYNFRAEPEVYDKIKQAKGLPTDEAVRVWARSDIRDAGGIFSEGGYGGYSGFGSKDRSMGNGVQEDFWGVRRQRVSYEGGSYIDICHWPLKAMSMDDIRKYRWPRPQDIFDFTTLPQRIADLNQGNEYFWMIETESLFDRCWALRGMEQFMTDMLVEPELADYMLSQMADFFLQYTQMILRASKGKLDAIGLYNDLGTQISMMISPELYRTFIKPWQKRLIALAHAQGCKVFYHSCGGILPVVEDLIEIGVDILDPLQMRAMKVSPEDLYRRFGGRVTFHGGLNTQHFMPGAMPSEIAQETRHLIQALGPDGGFIMAGTHLYQVDIPVENIAAVHQAIAGQTDSGAQ